MHYVKKILILLLGLLAISLASALLMITALGGDAMTVINQGTSTFLNIDIAWGTLINNGILFLIMLAFNRKQINIGTIGAAVLIGPFISMFMMILPDSFTDKIFINFIISLASLVICAFGLALYIYSSSGLGPFEGVVDILAKKIKFKFGYSKIIMDAIFFSLGALLGGVFNVSSVISVIIVGPLINLFLYLLNKTNLMTQTNKELDD